MQNLIKKRIIVPILFLSLAVLVTAMTPEQRLNQQEELISTMQNEIVQLKAMLLANEKDFRSIETKLDVSNEFTTNSIAELSVQLTQAQADISDLEQIDEGRRNLHEGTDLTELNKVITDTIRRVTTNENSI